MRRLLVLALAAFALVGCSTKEEPAKPAATPAATTPAPVAKVAKQKEAVPDKPLDLAEYERLMLTLKDCELQDRGIDRKCPAWETFDHARKTRGSKLRGMNDQLAQLGQKYITDPSPAIRLHAASLMGSLVGASPESQALIIKTLKTEQNPQVMRALIRTVSSKVAENAELCEALKSLAGHSDENVRIALNDAFTSTWAAGTEGTLELAMKAVENDPSPKVREQACKRLGNRAEEKVLPLLEKMTLAPGDNPKLYAACMNGLTAMWSAPVVPKTPSEKAYRLTIQRLSQTPRTEQMPPWNIMPNLAWAAKDQLKAAEPWLNVDDLKRVLTEIVSDRNAHWMARTSAINTLRRLGVTPEEFTKLAESYADVRDKPGNEANVLSALEKAAKGEPVFDRRKGARFKHSKDDEAFDQELARPKRHPRKPPIPAADAPEK